MKYLSLFSGIGGFELGIQQSYDNVWNKNRGTQPREEREHDEGGEFHTEDNGKFPICIGYSEIDKYATAIYQRHFPEHKNYGDITKIDADALPDFDLLVGGFPCQAFSIAGKRLGFADTRGTLFFDIARILKEKQPRLFLLENVKGLLSHDNGNTFKTIIATLDELGYDLQWQVLNSKNHGVPQNRERVFIVGHSRGTPRPQVFPFGITGEEDSRLIGQELSPTLDANYAKGWSPSGNQGKKRQMIHQLNTPVHSNDRVYAPDGISPTLNTMQGGNRQPFVSLRVQGDVDKRKVYTSEIAATLASNPTSDNTARATDGVRIRRLTPIECERLQGFPDRFTEFGADGEKISDTQRYKTLGNAVTVNVIRDIVTKLL